MIEFATIQHVAVDSAPATVVSGSVSSSQSGAPWTMRLQDANGATLAAVTSGGALKVDGSGSTQPVSVLPSATLSIVLTPAELASLATQLETAAPGENGSSTKKFRMRLNKWLVDNSKLTNVTPES